MGGGSAPSVCDVNLPTMDTLRHPVQVWPGFDKKRNFLPRANKAKAAQVQLLFVCDFWQWSKQLSQQDQWSTMEERHWKLCKSANHK